VETLGSDWRKHYDALVCKTPNFTLVKTKDVFMNESGRLIANFKLQTSDLFVAHDDLDIRLGEFKIQKGVGPKQHNGVLSVENALKTKDFWRIRIGIDNRTIPNVQSGEDYVLQKFSLEERKTLDEVFEKIRYAIFKTDIGK
jgi:PTH1 family peptidyl-tRNA hydrolase